MKPTRNHKARKTYPVKGFHPMGKVPPPHHQLIRAPSGPATKLAPKGSKRPAAPHDKSK